MRRARLILNPSSGRERGPEHLESLNAALKRRFDDVTTTVTSGDGDAERAAMTAAADGCDALFVAGGDGTVNEAMNGLSAARALDRVAVGIIPFGTGNDFAAALGIPTETDAALEVLLEGREAARRSRPGQRPRLREHLGRRLHRRGVGRGDAAAEDDRRPARLPDRRRAGAARVRSRLGRHHASSPAACASTRELYAFAVCNSRLIGGGRLIAPNAVIDDGLLDVCLIEAMSALEFVALARKVAEGEHVDDPRVSYFQASAIDDRAGARDQRQHRRGSVRA